MSRATKLFTEPELPAPTIKNRDNFPAYERSLEEQYIQTLMTNTFGTTFYANQKDLIKEADALHKEMIKKDPAFVAKALAYARNHGYMRTQPIYGLACLFQSEKGSTVNTYANQVFKEVIRTPKDLSDFLTITKHIRGNEGGRRLKRIIGDWLLETISEYWAIKYGADKDDKGYSLSDLLRLTHPTGARNPIVDYLLNKEVDLSSVYQIKEFEALKRATNDEEKIQHIRDGRLPHEVATSFAGNSKAIWNSIVPNLPIFALLKNLATLERHGVADENRKLLWEKFGNKEVISKSKILPFRFVEAEKHVNAGWLKDALRDGLENSFANLPDIDGKTTVCLDISGSMGDYIEIASVFGICLIKKADYDGHLILFDTSAEDFSVSKRDSILTQAKRIHARGGTDTSCSILKMLRENTYADNIILITDEQQNAGMAFLKAMNTYRKQINPDVKLFIIDVAPYRSAVVPDGTKNTWYIYGWSDQVLEFISLQTKGWSSIIEYIKGK